MNTQDKEEKMKQDATEAQAEDNKVDNLADDTAKTASYKAGSRDAK